jgi:hypothetical protein
VDKNLVATVAVERPDIIGRRVSTEITSANEIASPKHLFLDNLEWLLHYLL